MPTALPVLGPFAFLCHQKWDSAAKIPLIPPTTPVLMLSGARDDLVPREHMRALWEAVARRGEKRTAGGVEYKVGLERARYVEFEGGGHSALGSAFLSPALLMQFIYLLADDTCTQPGYWSAVSDFITSLGSVSQKEKEKETPAGLTRSSSL